MWLWFITARLHLCFPNGWWCWTSFMFLLVTWAPIVCLINSSWCSLQFSCPVHYKSFFQDASQLFILLFFCRVKAGHLNKIQCISFAFMYYALISKWKPGIQWFSFFSFPKSRVSVVSVTSCIFQWCFSGMRLLIASIPVFQHCGGVHYRWLILYQDTPVSLKFIPLCKGIFFSSWSSLKSFLLKF